MQIHIQHDGTQHGPYSLEVVQSLLRDGTYQSSDLAWHEGAAQWTPLASIPGIETDAVSSPPAISPRTSTLAIWSLVLGILGFLSLGISSIPAVICGHLAHRKINNSAGTLTGKGLAIAGFILGYVGVVLGFIALVMILLAVTGFAAGNAAIGKARKVTALATAVAIESSVNNYYTEYGKLPSEAGITNTVEDVPLVRTLLGEDRATNVRGIKFLSVREGNANKNGLNPSTFKLFDPWGNAYQVVLDTKYHDEVVVTRGGKTETLKPRIVAVFSVGEDGLAGTSDDVITW